MILNRTRMEHAETTGSHDAPTARPDVGHHSPLPDDVPLSVRNAIASVGSADGLRRATCATNATCATPDAYEDALGYVYRFNQDGLRIVSIDRPEDTDYKARQARSAARIAVTELRERAIAIVATQRPKFGRSRSSYHPLEGHRQRDLYVFRWEDCSAPLSESEDSPFVEVALYADGTLVRYVDTLLIPT